MEYSVMVCQLDLELPRRTCERGITEPLGVPKWNYTDLDRLR